MVFFTTFLAPLTRGMHDLCQEQAEELARMGAGHLALMTSLTATVVFGPALMLQDMTVRQIKNSVESA
ncbi:MAG: hypothetical protein K2X77_32780 [Candidatus Obscuribacterales bacterium]|nr:hypothetical protein [Candidatus Obscuribacterales bacterium]